MKKVLSFLFVLSFTIAMFSTAAHADSNLQTNHIEKLVDGLTSTVIQCGDDPDGIWRCVQTVYDDGSDCIVVDNEGAPNGIQFFGCDDV